MTAQAGDRRSDIERVLRTAEPHALLELARAELFRTFGADPVDLLMADYALTMLQPVAVLPYTTEPLTVNASAPGRAFGTQEPFVEDLAGGGVTVHVPVTTRGDRIGVLSLGLRTAPDPITLDDLKQIADVLAHEIIVAERDTDLYLQARRAERLTLAAEMQWQLLPARACARTEYSLGAQLEPAYAIYGDNFDWSTSANHLVLTVTNGMGEGIDAALLTNLAINALRNARRAGVPLTDQAALADQAIYGQHAGRQHVSTLLLRFDLTTGNVEVVDAGSPKLWRLRDGTVDPITFDAQLPLGMFDDTPYVTETFQVIPGDRLIFVTDGVYDVASPAGERYGQRALARAIKATSLLPATQVPRAVLEQLATHRVSTSPAEDDSMIVCLDWHGRQQN
ncbi:PP2C family protein-serine/threonine phosphatase [Amycolatopsis sp. YIM 10]|uniref:PP2C family protein-serine/threonine phosphatase n=1 Tax=Amycolatopsis sp. YIM 10 TaxID=2653857 RepID=UPI0012904B09|nr:PP2C family protein-serine/threonine phosphatase [Amycolatopsis sp. YIM 10]QFU86631.1 Stage II sporulation protein E (SpoIIE) [Amycolatopsis sp. YIM 10]